MKKLRQIAYLLSFSVLRPLSFLVPLTFMLTALYKTRRFFYIFFSGRRKRASQTFDLCFPELSPKEKGQILDSVLFQALAFPLIDVYLDRITEQTSSLVMAEHPEYLKKAVNSGRGVVLVFPHGLHNISLPVAGMTKSVHIVVAHLYEKKNWLTRLQNFIRIGMQRKIATCRYIYLKKNSLAPLQIVKLLKQKKVVAISIDGAYAGKFYKLPFLGDRSILFTAGPFRLAASLKVPIVPIFGGFDMDSSRVRIIYGSVIEGDNPEAMAQEYARQFQNMLKKAPYCWTGWWRLQTVERDVFKPFPV